MEKNLKQCQTCHDFEGETHSYEYLEVKLCKNKDGVKVYLCEECIDAFNRLKPGSFQVV